MTRRCEGNEACVRRGCRQPACVAWLRAQAGSVAPAPIYRQPVLDKRKVAPKAPIKAAGKAWENRPISPPPDHLAGQPRRLHPIRVEGGKVDADEAQAWAETRDWWPLVTRARPYRDARYWIWVLRAEPDISS